MTSRLRRLHADYREVTHLFTHHPFISLERTEGDPPERYFFEFRVRGIRLADDGEEQIVQSHRAEVFLPLDYPRNRPFCRMLSPVFHPNIDSVKICIGDHWSAGQSLASIVVRIAEMICYQSYNTKSPLNGLAAAWTERNVARLPLEREDISAGI